MHYTRHDRLKAVKALLRRGADLNHSNKQGLGVLHVSAGAGHVELADYLGEPRARAFYVFG
jgi:ankyrin repeat protein